MSTRLIRAIAYGLLTVAGVLGLAALVWAAMPQGAPVTYTASDVATMPTGTTFTAQILNALGAFTASSSMTAGGTIAYTGDITPPQITTNQDNYNPTGLATAAVLRLSSNAAWSITGLQGGSDGRVLLIENVGSQNIILAAGPTTSTDTNEFAFPADVTMPPKALVLVKYDATDSKWRTISPTLTGAAVRATTLTLAQQSGDPTTPAADDWLIYTKSTGLFIRDDLGNITGPLGTGGGGGGGGLGMTAAMVIPSNITLSGEQTFETIVTNFTRVFVVGQTTPTQNGFYITNPSTWTRASDALAGTAFTAGTLVTITNGLASSAGNRGSTWMFLTSGTYNSSNLTAVKTGLGPSGELSANKSTVSTAVANGYIGADAAGTVAYNRIGSFAQHTALAAGSQITVTARQMGIEGSGTPPTDLTSTPQMVAGVANQEVTLIGTHATQTVKLDNGNGLRLCGNTGSVIVGLNGPKVSFRYNTTLTVWEQTNCLGLEQAKNTGASIGNAVDEASGVTIGDVASGTYCVMFGSTTKCYCASAACDNTVQLSAGKSLLIKKHDGSTLASLANDTGASTGFGGAVVDRSVRVTHNSSQTISAGASDLPIQFDNEVCTACYDTDNMHNSATNNSRITFTTGGKYLVMCHGRFAAGTNALSATLLDANIRLNGTTILSGAQRFAPQAPSVYVNPSVQYNFAAGDFIEMVVSFDGTSATSFDVAAGRFPVCSAKQL